MAGDSGFKPQKEISRIKAQVRRLEKERDRSFPELGKLAYQASLEGRLTDPALLELCGRIKEMDSQAEQGKAQMADLQAQVQQMKEIKKTGASGPVAVCPLCGASVTPGIKFCGNCGAAFTQGPPAVQTPAGIPCPSCGSLIAPNAQFCGECGKPLSAAGAPAGPSSSDTYTAPPPPAPPAPSPPPAQAADRAPSSTVRRRTQGARLKCSACGALIEEANAVFCGECGAKVG
jgi:DNA-directed RNA polymerase subunit RPC12/RpoP